MALEKLVSSLRQNEQAQVHAIWARVEDEAESLRQEAARNREKREKAHEQTLQAALRKVHDDTQREAAMQKRHRQFAADRTLAESLHGIALEVLEDFWQHHRARIFAALVGELPQRSWSEIQVHPQDQALAANFFPPECVRPDDQVTAGFIATDHEHGLTVDSRLAVRLDTVWDQLLPRLMEACREPALD